MYDFHFHRPASLSEVENILANSEDPSLLAGGQTLIPTLKQRLAQPTDVIDLSQVAELQADHITYENGTLTIGAMVTHNNVATHASVQENLPALAQLASHIGDPQVRNRGTIGGSVANNDPSADYPAACLALNATIKTNKRNIGADDFFVSLFETALDEGEFITSISFPVTQDADYQKFIQPASRFALVGVFVVKTNAAIRVAVTGASEQGVFRLSAAEDILSKNFSADAIDGLSVSADDMIADIHGGADYRAHLAKVLTQRAVANI